MIKILENNIGENLGDLGYDNDFSDITSKVLSMKKKIDKLDFINIKNFCSVKDYIKKMRRQATDWEKYLQKTQLIKDCSLKYSKDSSK